MRFFNFTVVFLLFYSLAEQSPAISSDYASLFKENGVTANSKNCLSKCTTVQVDMGSFMCPSECDEYCNAKCEIDLYWKNKIKQGRPSAWDFKSELEKLWTNEEKLKAAEALDRLPTIFKSIAFDGVYRMKKSVQLVNPGTTRDNSVVIYDAAFNNPSFSFDHVLLHEISHVVYSNMTKSERRNYESSLGWTKRDLVDHRDGEFIVPAAKDSPEEDFANNVETFLLNPSLLKDKVPIAYDWILKKYSKNFKLKEKCKNEK